MVLIEVWNEIDLATLTILSEDVADIWQDLATGATSTFVRPPELGDDSFSDTFKDLAAATSTTLGTDRFAITRPETVSLIPTGLFQEKTMRVLSAFLAFRELIDSGLEARTSHWYLAEKATVDLLVVDACSLFDNLFEHRSANSPAGEEDSLIEIWQKANVKGVDAIVEFQREVGLEDDVRKVRNTFSAHVDPDVPLADLEAMLKGFPLQQLNTYLASIWSVFADVCRGDVRTRHFLVHGLPLVGIAPVASSAVKSFR
ncbi:MAG: hypothetical protein V3V08_25565 [Nannocystaceae bacterium]